MESVYGKLLPKAETTEKERNWASSQEPTYPSVVLYTTVSKELLPKTCSLIEMLVGNPIELDESESPSISRASMTRASASEDEHIVIAIGQRLGIGNMPMR